MHPVFLSIDAIYSIHEDMIRRYGGSMGVRDAGLLDAALAMPRATFGGEFLHEDIFQMAAAYLYHIVQNHPFVDGNKRVGFTTAVTFLDVNGLRLEADEDEAADMVLSVAQGKTNKAEIADFLRRNSQTRE